MENHNLDTVIQILIVILLLSLILLVAAATLWIKKMIYSFSKSNFSPSYKYNMARLESEIEYHLHELEIRHRLNFSPESRTLLITPIIEYYGADSYQVDGHQWKRSLNLIAETIREQPSQSDSIDYSTGYINVTSFSIIKAFTIKFCDIPPFCKPTR